MVHSNIASRAAAWVVPLAAATEAHGNKAAGLAALMRAAKSEREPQLEVPGGVAIATDAHAAWLAEPANADDVLAVISQAVQAALSLSLIHI